MTFPFSVSFNRRLKATITSDNQPDVLLYIMKRISDDKADNVVIDDTRVTYKGSTSNWNWSLFGPVDDGIFNLIYKNGTWLLNYQINMRTLFRDTAILSIVAGAFGLATGGRWWIGLAAFAWLCGGNWVIILLRHGAVATEIAAGIDELICGKIEPPEFDKMNGPLKSWF